MQAYKHSTINIRTGVAEFHEPRAHVEVGGIARSPDGNHMRPPPGEPRPLPHRVVGDVVEWLGGSNGKQLLRTDLRRGGWRIDTEAASPVRMRQPEHTNYWRCWLLVQCSTCGRRHEMRADNYTRCKQRCQCLHVRVRPSAGRAATMLPHHMVRA